MPQNEKKLETDNTFKDTSNITYIYKDLEYIKKLIKELKRSKLAGILR